MFLKLLLIGSILVFLFYKNIKTLIITFNVFWALFESPKDYNSICLVYVNVPSLLLMKIRIWTGFCLQSFYNNYYFFITLSSYAYIDAVHGGKYRPQSFIKKSLVWYH